MSATATAAKKKAAPSNGLDSVTVFGPDFFKDGYDKFQEHFETFADFNKGSVDAVMASVGAYSDGVEKLVSEYSTFLKTSYEGAASTAKSVTSAKNPQEAFEIQADFARDTVEKNINQFSKLSDLALDTAKKSSVPLAERYSELVEKIQSFRP